LVWSKSTSVTKSSSSNNVLFYFISAVFPVDLKVEFADIEEGFLVNEDPRYEEDKIKRRGQNNSYTYQRKYRTKKNQNGDYVQ